MQKILLEFINDEGERSGQDLRTWDEFESRYEENELKWISDYVVSNLVFIKNELKITDNEAISHVLHVLWTTLDLFAENQDLEGAKANRYENLRSGLENCFAQRLLNKEQVGKTLEYCRKSIFGHLQLYIACLGQKK